MCTSFRLKAEDGTCVVGRTMEFAVDLSSELLAVPAGTTFTGTAPEGCEGATWTATHGYIGMNAFGCALALDGVNDAGLSVGVLYFPHFVGYQDPTPAGNVAPEEVAGFLLGTCGTVAEVAAAIETITVWAHTAGPFGAALPLHYVVNDRSGASIVIEHVAGAIRTHDNPFGVATNSPTFDWHLINLQNYAKLSAYNVPAVDLEGHALHALGEGSGLLGLPGDWTPPSRFVRAVVLSSACHPGPDGASAARTANHLLYALDIPLGVVRQVDDRGPEELTQWATISDLRNGQLYVRYYGDPFIHQVDVADALAAATAGPVLVPLTDPSGPWTVPVDLGTATAVDPAARPF